MIRRIATAPALVFAAFLCIALLAGAERSHAQVKPEPLADNANWKSHTYVSDGSKVCYMHAKPAKSTGNYKRRGAPNIMVTRRQGSRTTEEVSVTSGYPYPEGKPVKVTIDGRRYNFDLTHEEHAWVRRRGGRRHRRQGHDPRPRAEGARGCRSRTPSPRDTYSLIGFTKIHDAISRACP